MLLVQAQYIFVFAARLSFEFFTENVNMANLSTERKLAIERSSKQLLHHFYCQEKECSSIPCQKIGKVYKHLNDCEIKNCRICRQFLALVNYHSRTCKQRVCKVPQCFYFRVLKQSQRFVISLIYCETLLNLLFLAIKKLSLFM